MKIKLKHKLIFIYTALILTLMTVLALTTSYSFMNEFNDYVITNRESEVNKINNEVLELFQSNGVPEYKDLYELGVDALEEGLILMVNIDYNNKIFCMSDIVPIESNKMLSKMETTLKSIYPHIEGEYREDTYVIEDDTEVYGYVTLGYYGPIYYTEFEAIFLKAVKKSIYTTVLIFFLLSSIVVYVLSYKLAQPIIKVSENAEEIGKGNYTETINIKSTTIEIENLIKAINTLAKNLENEKYIKKQMSVNYTHEIRTPITCVLTTLEGMQDGVFEITNERLENMYKEIQRISNMVEDIDRLIETSDNEIVLNKTQVSINNILEICTNNFQSQFESKDIALKYNNTLKENVIVLADEEKIKSAIENLLSNALKYTDSKGEVLVSLLENQQSLIIKVKDNGIGIDDNDKRFIFEHLYRAEKSRVKAVEGFGVGLSICRNIVLAHDGLITVDSVLGEGSEFTISLKKEDI